MILRLVWASVRQRSGRSALLLGGYALGVGVTIVLLSVGQAMVDQARDRQLLGGGNLIVLPEGIDLETLPDRRRELDVLLRRAGHAPVP